ncbi:MAG: UvrD-helicase domain-containing protein, partial [Cyclonatronaceae bacterium]
MASSSSQHSPSAAHSLNPFKPFEAPLQGVNLVESSAGTGKTYNISGLVVRMLAETPPETCEGGFDPSNILVVTFTRAATQELRERISRRVQESVAVLEGSPVPSGDVFLEDVRKQYAHRPECLSNLQKARQNMDQASIYTIHGFCQQALQEHALESNSSFDVQYTGNDRELRIEAADTLWREELKRLKAPGGESELLRSILLNQLKTPDALVSLFADIAGKPYVRFNPDWDMSDLEAHHTKIKTAIANMKAAYDRDAIIALFDDAAGVYAAFKPAKLAEMLDSFEEECRAGFSFGKQKFWDLGSHKPKTKKGYDGLHHPFFDAVEAFIEANPEEFSEGYHVVLARRYLQQFQALKEERRLRSFDDILLSMQQA